MDMANTLSRTCKASYLAAVTGQDRFSLGEGGGGGRFTGEFQPGQLIQVLHCQELSTVIGLFDLHSTPQNLNRWSNTWVLIVNVVYVVWRANLPWLCLMTALQPSVLPV